MSKAHAVRGQTAGIAVPLALAALGVAPALAAGGASGLSLAPPIVEHAAVTGKVGSVKVANNTGQSIAISVSTHPWIQSASGAAVPNQRATLGGVRPSSTSFVLGNGASKVVSLSLTTRPKSGSLYGNVDVIGIPARSGGPNAVTIGYRLVASLRLDPVHIVRRASAGAATVRGSGGNAAVALAVRNAGNTIEPIGGSVHITGARGAENGSIGAERILPGKTVDLPVFKLAGALPAGAYSLAAALTQGGHRILSVKRSFVVR